MQAVKGMVQVAGTTYRIIRLQPGQYEVVRILDDRSVGTFATAPKLQVLSHRIELPIMNEIALSAVKRGKTSWVGRLFASRT
jgi:hypothetical protein